MEVLAGRNEFDTASSVLVAAGLNKFGTVGTFESRVKADEVSSSVLSKIPPLTGSGE